MDGATVEGALAMDGLAVDGHLLMREGAVFQKDVDLGRAKSSKRGAATGAPRSEARGDEKTAHRRPRRTARTSIPYSRLLSP
jgi:hypothetical protein